MSSNFSENHNFPSQKHFDAVQGKVPNSSGNSQSGHRNPNQKGLYQRGVCQGQLLGSGGKVSWCYINIRKHVLSILYIHSTNQIITINLNK